MRQRNPLVILSRREFAPFTPENQREAIELAAVVCRFSWKQNHKPIRQRRLWRWLVRKMDYAQATEDFRQYREAGCSGPPGPSEHAQMVTSKPGDNSGRQFGGPYLARLYTFVARLPDREISFWGGSAYDFPLGLASFLYLTDLEQKGEARIENERERQIEEEWQKHMAGVPEDERLE